MSTIVNQRKSSDRDSPDETVTSTSFLASSRRDKRRQLDNYGCPVLHLWPAAPIAHTETKRSFDVRIETVLVIGGAGFLGRHIVQNLADSQAVLPHLKRIRVLDRQKFPAGFQLKLGSNSSSRIRLELELGDIRRKDQISRAFRSVDAVIHTANLIALGPDVDEQTAMDINVLGTRNILDLCQENDIRVMVYTSSVVCTRKWLEFEQQAEQEIDFVESDMNNYIFPLYSKTKLLAEQMIRQTNAIRSAIIRPSGIYGEGDYLYLPTMIQAAKNNRGAMLKIGCGREKIHIARVYAGNCAWAHVLALGHLADENAHQAITGRSFHVSDDSPCMANEEFCEPFLQANDCYVSSITIPYWLICLFLTVLDLLLRLVSPFVKLKFPMDKSQFYIYCSTATYNDSKIRQLLGYRPRFPYQVARERALCYYEGVSRNGEYLAKARSKAKQMNTKS